jgi:hypothetical protein
LLFVRPMRAAWRWRRSWALTQCCWQGKLYY